MGKTGSFKSKKQRDLEKELFYDARYQHRVLDGRKDKNRSCEKQHWKKAIEEEIKENEED